MRAVPGMTLCRKDTHFGNVLLTHYPVHHIHRLDLSVKGREPRGAIMASVEVARLPIRVIATHLGLKRDERRHQVRQILNELRSDDPGVTLLLGDLNEWDPFGMVSRFLRIHFGKAGSPPLIRPISQYCRWIASWCGRRAPAKPSRPSEPDRR
ncbi:MAG: hypothetical protein P8165_19660 [Deltaproteobacteria bacterium]